MKKNSQQKSSRDGRIACRWIWRERDQDAKKSEF